MWPSSGGHFLKEKILETQTHEQMHLEALITEREGMIAENKQREFKGEAMAFVLNDFIAIQQQMYDLPRHL